MINFQSEYGLKNKLLILLLTKKFITEYNLREKFKHKRNDVKMKFWFSIF